MDLSGLGSETRDLLGSFLLAILHLTALGRSAIPAETRKPFAVYADEAHRFTSGPLEDLITEARKYGVGLTLAHQYLSQFEAHKRDAIGCIGTTVVFNVDSKDAAFLKKDLKDKVEVSDLISLEVGEAIARIGTRSSASGSRSRARSQRDTFERRSLPSRANGTTARSPKSALRIAVATSDG